MKKFDFKKFGKVFLSLLLAMLIFISSFCLSASAVTVQPSEYRDLTDFDYGFYCVGHDGIKNTFYNGLYLTDGYGEPVSGYNTSNDIATSTFKDMFAWNGRQNYFYLHSTDTSVSGRYKWGGRLWFAKVDNNDYHRDDWSGKNLSYWQKPFLTIPKVYSLYCRLFFALPQLSYDTYSSTFLASDISIKGYTTDYSATFESTVKLFAVAPYVSNITPPWGLGVSPLRSVQCCAEFVIASSEQVDITSLSIEISGISQNYGGLLVDNMILFCTVTDDNDWGNNQIEQNAFQRWFNNLIDTISDGFNNLIDNIVSFVGGAINGILSGDVLEVIEGSILSLGDIIMSLFNVANTQGGSLPVG